MMFRSEARRCLITSILLRRNRYTFSSHIAQCFMYRSCIIVSLLFLAVIGGGSWVLVYIFGGVFTRSYCCAVALLVLTFPCVVLYPPPPLSPRIIARPVIDSEATRFVFVVLFLFLLVFPVLVDFPFPNTRQTHYKTLSGNGTRSALGRTVLLIMNEERLR